MKGLFGLLTLLGALVPAAPAAALGPARIVSEHPIANHGFALTISTPAFAKPTYVQVFLPAGYDSQPRRRWPVTYYLHGAQGDNTRFNAWYGDLIHGVPSIFVAPDGGALGFYTDWFNGGAGGPPMYESYDIDQLIPLIDSHFRTIARRSGRAVIGESMGGYGVMTYAARHPDLFATAISMSGFLDSNFPPAALVVSASPLVTGDPFDSIYGPRVSQSLRWHGHNPTDLADNLRDVALQVRTAEGDPDPSIEPPGPGVLADCPLEGAIFQTNMAFRRRLVALGIPHVWKDYVKGCHTIPNFRREFTDSLPGLEQVFAHPRPYPSTFTYRSVEPRFSIWGWKVEADPARALEFLELRHAGRSGLTLVGSGTTSLTTPPFFRGLQAVDVVAPGGTQVLAPDAGGRVHFSVDLGAPHRNQQYTAAAGEGGPGYFTSRTVTFAPRGRRARRR